MIDSLRRVRPFVAAPIAVVMLALTLSVPLLDSGVRGDDPSFRADSHAAGYVGHDHSVCVQYGASAWSPAIETRLSGSPLVREIADPPSVVPSAARSPDTPFQPRGPPIA